ncbi:MAG: C-GCAxxG-C-C family protein [Candidatus Aenigmatarchaeota archaeon]
MSISEILEKIEKTAYEYDKVYHGCSQCTLKAIQEHLNLGNGEAFKAASALAGGIARMGETCGALLGAIMAIGLAYGREKLEVTFSSINYQKAMKVAMKLYQNLKKSLAVLNVKIFKRIYLEDLSTLIIQRILKNL